MNEPHENLDHDPFADDAQRRPSRLRRPVARDARRSLRARCHGAVAGMPGASVMLRRTPIRHLRPCPHTARRPLR